MNPIKEAILARLRRRRASVCDPAHEVEPADDSAQDTPPAAAAAPSPAPRSETRPAAPQSAPVTVAPAMPVPRPDTPASATAIADACSKAGEPSLITSFIQRRATLAEVDARLDDIWRMRDVARRATNIAEGIDLTLIDKLVEMGASLESTKMIYHMCILTRQSAEIVNSRSVDPRADHGWGDIIAKQAGAKK